MLILADDLGYGDLGCYGGKIPTPNLERLAKEGARFTDFYVPQAVGSASRAALMTGCYPNRIGILGALAPKSKVALNTNETTIAEVLKARGYSTAIFGKWHLGDHASALPGNHGFDIFYGLPYSSDMWPHHPVHPNRYPALPLIESNKIVEFMPDQTKLIKSYTDRAVSFIEKSKSRPFFLYVAYNSPHVPLFPSAKFKDKTGQGPYADVVAEVDWSVGEIVKALKALRLEEKTLVLFTSDNGPWLFYGDHAGSAGKLREGKGTSFEGGVRVPFIARWVGKIPTNLVCRELATSMDLLPTIGKLAGGESVDPKKIDGKDIWPLMSSTRGAKSPHKVFYYYWNRDLQAVRSGNWKLHLPHHYFRPESPGANGVPGDFRTEAVGVELYDLDKDSAESMNVAGQNPEVVKRLQALAEQAREDLGDLLTRREARNERQPGRIDPVSDH